MIPRCQKQLGLSVILIAILGAICRVRGEVFTAIVDMEPLLETHKRIIDDLDDYIEKEERRLHIIKRHLSLYKEEHIKAMDDIPNYLGNPINAFTLIKRLTTDLDRIETNIKLGTEYIKNITVTQKDVKYPTYEDLGGAAQALIRLQDTYQLNVTQLADGQLNKVAYSTPMTVSDCYQLARSLYSLEDYQNSILWMQEALRKYQREDEELTFNKIDILEYISFAYYLLEDLEQALEWTERLLREDPKHARALGNVPHYRRAIAERQEKVNRRKRGETNDEDELPVPPKRKVYWNVKERKSYESLCRGEMEIPKSISSRLKCRYMTENHPFLKIAPFKLEEVYLDPDVYVFHNVLSDDEIEYVKDLARPRFKRAVVHDPVSGELVPAQYRISKSSWLKDEDFPTVAAISRRAADLSGLNMASAEELQVVNYGIGGHYEPHFDFARSEEKHAFQKLEGNRIATVLFYMSDVAQGGATVFTELGLTVFPEKGSVLFWHNLHPSGEGNFATRHAACPVLRGSKWVSNKWLHQGGQELLRPCGLEYEAEGIVRPVARPVPRSPS